MTDNDGIKSVRLEKEVREWKDAANTHLNQFHRQFGLREQAEAQLSEVVRLLEKEHLERLGLCWPADDCRPCHEHRYYCEGTLKGVCRFLVSLKEEEPEERDVPKLPYGRAFPADQPRAVCGCPLPLQSCKRVSVCCSTPHRAAKFCPRHHKADFRCDTHGDPWPCQEGS